VSVEALVREVRLCAERDGDRGAVSPRVGIAAQRRQDVAAVDQGAPHVGVGLPTAGGEHERTGVHDGLRSVTPH
jgi:hypothetical protein